MCLISPGQVFFRLFHSYACALLYYVSVFIWRVERSLDIISLLLSLSLSLSRALISLSASYIWKSCSLFQLHVWSLTFRLFLGLPLEQLIGSSLSLFLQLVSSSSASMTYSVPAITCINDRLTSTSEPKYQTSATLDCFKHLTSFSIKKLSGLYFPTIWYSIIKHISYRRQLNSISSCGVGEDTWIFLKSKLTSL